MEIGALTVMTIGFRERELVLDLFELITGLRMNHAFIRPGGVAQDMPPGALEKIDEFIELMKKRLPEYAALCNANPIFKGRLVDVGYLDLAGCLALGATGPVLRATGYDWDLRKKQPYCGYETYDFDVVTWDTCRRLRPVPDPARRDVGVAAHRRAVRRPAAGPRGRAGDDRRQEDRLAEPSSPSAPTAWATRSTTSATSWASRWRP